MFENVKIDDLMKEAEKTLQNAKAEVKGEAESFWSRNKVTIIVAACTMVGTTILLAMCSSHPTLL